MVSFKKKFPNVAAFETHGVEYFDETSKQQLIGVCPFCGKKKFYTNYEIKLWDCKACGKSGNMEAFTAAIHKRNKKDASLPILKTLAKHRGLKVSTLRQFDVGYCEYNDEFTLPIFSCLKSGKQTLVDVPRYNLRTKRCFATRGATSGVILPRKLHGSSTVWLCEGEWDTMAVFEILSELGIEEDVIGLRGASNLPKVWQSFFSQKDVNLLFDNDEPGQNGVAKAWQNLATHNSRMKRLKWKGGDFPDKFDVRDLYQKTHKSDAKKAYKKIQSMLSKDIPEGIDVENCVAVEFGDIDVDSKEQHEIDPKGKGMSRGAVVKAYRKWLYLPDSEPLDIMYGSVFANRIESDPLWMFLVAPPGGSKSELLMTLSMSPLIYSTTSLTPKALISGANYAGGGDPSMIKRLLGKTLIVKDFTTILTMNPQAKDEIFGILRDAYDGRIEKEFGNGQIRRYEGQFGIVAGVTPVIDDFTLTSSVLGERFLKYRIKRRGKINVGREVISRALDNLTNEEEMRHDLKDIARTVLDRPIDKPYPKLNKVHANKIIELAQWTAAMRGCVSRERYSQQLTYKPTAEIGTRLSKQLATLGLGISMFQQKHAIDDKVYNLLTKVARDTAPDRLEEVAKQMYTHGHGDYSGINDIATWSKFPNDTTRRILEDMALLHIVVRKQAGTVQYRLSDSMINKLDIIGMYTFEKSWKKGLQALGKKALKPKAKAKTKPVRQRKRSKK